MNDKRETWQALKQYGFEEETRLIAETFGVAAVVVEVDGKTVAQWFDNLDERYVA